jgi:hypothetical protein
MTRDVKKEFITITFGSVTIKTERPSPEEIKKNILNGQMAFARAIEAFKTKGVKLNATRFNQAEDKIILDSKVSKDLFIKLLMDNFLTSDLTKFHYESVAKDSLEESVVAE